MEGDMSHSNFFYFLKKFRIANIYIVGYFLLGLTIFPLHAKADSAQDRIYVCKAGSYLNTEIQAPNIFIRIFKDKRMQIIYSLNGNFIDSYDGVPNCLKELEDGYCRFDVSNSRYRKTGEYFITHRFLPLPKDYTNFDEDLFYSFASETSITKEYQGQDGWRIWPKDPQQVFRTWSVTCRKSI
jgi:hypothetical protein